MQKVDRQLFFVEPMQCLPVAEVPQGAEWFYEVKLDGYRCQAIKQRNEVRLFSRNGKEFRHFGSLHGSIHSLPGRTFILDGEIVALDEQGHFSLSLLQQARGGKAMLQFYIFDVLYFDGQDFLQTPLHERRDFLEHTLHRLPSNLRLSPILKGRLSTILKKIRELEFEGLVAKRRNSIYEAGARSGAWQKHKTQRSDEFFIGGYTGGNRLEELVVGEMRQGELHYAGSIRNGFVPATRSLVLKSISKLKSPRCPFVNLPERRGLHRMDSDKMRSVQWIRPRMVVELAFNERTPDGHLRHSRYLRLRPDKS